MDKLTVICVFLLACFVKNLQSQGIPGLTTTGLGTGTGAVVGGGFPNPFNQFATQSTLPTTQTGGLNLLTQFGTPLLTQPTQPVGFNTPFTNQITPPFAAGANLMLSIAQNAQNYRYATCYFNDSLSTVRGRADFRQFTFGDSSVDVRIQLSGLPPTALATERGIHIHEFGDIGDQCSRVGPHFNPGQTNHGAQQNWISARHVGDLGNIRPSPMGYVSTQFRDQVVSLRGPLSVLGRSFVIKFERDDLGMGGNQASQMNGNTRTPVACCVIARTSSENWMRPLSFFELQTTGMETAGLTGLTGMGTDMTGFGMNNLGFLGTGTGQLGAIGTGQLGQFGMVQPGTLGTGQLGTFGTGQLGTFGTGQLGTFGTGQLGTFGTGQSLGTGTLGLGSNTFIQPGTTGVGTFFPGTATSTQFLAPGSSAGTTFLGGTTLAGKKKK